MDKQEPALKFFKILKKIDSVIAMSSTYKCCRLNALKSIKGKNFRNLGKKFPKNYFNLFGIFKYIQKF